MLRELTMAVLLCACSDTPEPVTPPPAPDDDTVTDPSPEPAPSPQQGDGEDPLHAALVATHKKAVEECFGGFGKGAPYSADLKVSGEKVESAKVEALGTGHGPLPADCISKHFQAMAVPSGTGSSVRARFAVKNPDCDLPTCDNAMDAPCHFKRDIACSVVVDAK